MMKQTGLYIHIPFCDGKCPYCSFYSKKGSERQLDRYTEAVISAIAKYPHDFEAETVYFGGDLSLSRQKGLDKLVTRMIRNSILESEDEEAVLPTLLPEHVRTLADRLRKK